MIKEGISVFYSKDWLDYELLDTGEGEKLERFGKYTFVRPYEDAVWPKTLSKKEWDKADGKFWSSKVGAKPGWKMEQKIDEEWEMSYKDIKFLASPTSFRHLGFFPEQASHWDFIEEKIKEAKKNTEQPIKFLNLFGYTGVASLFAIRAGAEVTHVDASKQTLDWAKENQKVSGLDGLPMRVIEDDVLKFLEREEKRGNKYDAVIMDPPKFGRGPKGEVWKIEDKLQELLLRVQKVLSNKPIFVILTSYAIESSSLSLGHALSEAMKDLRGRVESGELCILEKSNSRLISLANTAVWSADMV
jgi:23S rRNA (cytosine1962-C5)-methyltransferase